MRFVTFNHDGITRAGALVDSATSSKIEVLDLSHEAFSDCLKGAGPDLLAMIETGLNRIARRIMSRSGVEAGARLPLAEVRLLAPLPNPPRIVGAAHNYRCALRERGLPLPDAPVLFEKFPTTVIGPDVPVVLPAGVGGVTYEAELAVVIGRRAEKVSTETSLEHVAGYTLFNDVSASEVIKADGQFVRGKNFRTFGPMGPWLATPEEVDLMAGHRLTLSVDGEMLQDGSTVDLVFGIAELISRLSHEVPLVSGTVIATGTPAGVAALQTPPTWLKPGMVMTVAMEGFGHLSNPVESETASHGR